MSLANKFTMNLNTKEASNKFIPVVTANDTTVFEFEVYDGKEKIELLETYNFNFVTKPVGKGSVLYPAELNEDGKVVVEVNFADVNHGLCDCALVMYEGEKRVSTMRMKVDVKGDLALQGDLPSESRRLIIADEELLTKAVSAAEDLENAVGEAGSLTERFNTFNSQLEETKKKTTQYQNPLTQIKGQLYEHPTFTKFEQNPVLTQSDCQWLVDNDYNMYWPWMVYMEPILGESAIDKFYLYYSSDHGSSAGGIGLATAPTPLGPFTDVGRIYFDNVEGNQTETPSVIWNEKTNKFHMYYHNNAAGRMQSSLVATSSDGLNWTRYGITIDVPDIEFPGDGHTGYMRVYRIGETWVAHHLMGGGGTFHYGISYSQDGFVWQTDPRPILGFGDQTDSPASKRLEFISLYPFFVQRNIWAALTVSPYEVGLNNATKEMYIARMDNPRKFSNLRKVFGGEVGGWDAEALKQPHIIEYEGKLYMYYTALNTDGKGAIGIAIGEV